MTSDRVQFGLEVMHELRVLVSTIQMEAAVALADIPHESASTQALRNHIDQLADVMRWMTSIADPSADQPDAYDLRSAAWVMRVRHPDFVLLAENPDAAPVACRASDLTDLLDLVVFWVTDGSCRAQVMTTAMPPSIAVMALASAADRSKASELELRSAIQNRADAMGVEVHVDEVHRMVRVDFDYLDDRRNN